MKIFCDILLRTADVYISANEFSELLLTIYQLHSAI